MLTLKAPAKINWFLHVLGKRPDGYHNIQSLIQCVSLYDSLTFEESDTLEVLTDAPVALEENLVYRAALALRAAAATEKGARITLEKHIPLAAGLGGGSSDCACTLKGLNNLWGLDLSKEELAALAAGLGSDVPFFLNSPSALVEGRGERVMPVSLRRAYTILLVKPPVGVSAGWAYSGLGGVTESVADSKVFLKALEGRDYISLNKMSRNDLEGPVLRRYPEIRELKEKMFHEGALLSAMSGSGPTVFGVFRSREEATDAVSAMERGRTAPHWSAVVETLI